MNPSVTLMKLQICNFQKLIVHLKVLSSFTSTFTHTTIQQIINHTHLFTLLFQRQPIDLSQ